jgi:hypothetical protein
MGIIGSYVMWTLPLNEREHQAENVFGYAVNQRYPQSAFIAVDLGLGARIARRSRDEQRGKKRLPLVRYIH